MSKISAEIHIGGKIKRSVAKELIHEIISLGLDCDGCVEESTYDYIMGFQRDDVLILRNDSDYGRFTLLERFLIENEIEFSRYTSMSAIQLPEITHYRIGMKNPEDYISDGDDGTLVAEGEIRKVIRMLKNEDIEKSTIKKAVSFLSSKCSGDINSLEVFKVVED